MMEIRIDKWLWTMRLYKTRSIAAEACKKGWISRNGTHLKPAATVVAGEVIQVRRGPVTYSFKIRQLTANRVGAKLVPEYMDNVTTSDQLEILQLQQLAGQLGRARGTGRPTKKERRDLEQYVDSEYAADFEDWDEEEEQPAQGGLEDWDWLGDNDENNDLYDLDED